MYRSLARRASAARAILLVNAASLHSSQPVAQVVPSKFVAKRGERDGSGARKRNHNQIICLLCYVRTAFDDLFLNCETPTNDYE